MLVERLGGRVGLGGRLRHTYFFFFFLKKKTVRREETVLIYSSSGNV